MNGINKSNNLYGGYYFTQEGYSDEQKEDLIKDAYADLTVFYTSSLLEYDIPINKQGCDVEVKDLMSFIMMLPEHDGMSVRDSKVIAMMFEMIMTRHSPDRAAFSLNGMNHAKMTDILGDHGRYTEDGIRAILRVLRYSQIHYRATYLSLELMCTFAEHALKHSTMYNVEPYLNQIPLSTISLVEMDMYRTNKGIGEQLYV